MLYIQKKYIYIEDEANKLKRNLTIWPINSYTETIIDITLKSNIKI